MTVSLGRQGGSGLYDVQGVTLPGDRQHANYVICHGGDMVASSDKKDMAIRIAKALDLLDQNEKNT